MLMLKMFQKAILKPLKLQFEENHLWLGLLPDQWKKGNIPILRKGDKELVKHCRLSSLFPICGKVVKHFIFNDFLNTSKKTI